ncbi:MAG: clostripain-related cysteine peptidase [Candidatus Ozemobacteraceae bacterium]
MDSAEDAFATENVPVPAPAPVVQREWTFLVYQANENSIYGPLIGDFNELGNATFPADTIAVVVQTSLFEIGDGRWQIGNGTMSHLVGLPAGNAADPDRLRDFVAWGTRVFPARHTALILASHGLGWRNGADPAAKGVSKRFGVLSDDPEKSMMNIPGLARGIAQGLTQRTASDSDSDSAFPSSLSVSLSPHFDLIAFDACLMGMIEVVWELRGLTDCLVVSEPDEPNSGFAYDQILAELASNPRGIDGPLLGQTICRTYASSSENEGAGLFSGLLSTIDMNKSAFLCSAFTNWSEAILKEGARGVTVLSSLRDARTGPPSSLWPTESYALQAMDCLDYRDLSELASAAVAPLPATRFVADRLQQAISAVIISQSRFGNQYKRAHGLSVALPGEAASADYADGRQSARYADLALTKETSWGTVLSRVLRQVTGLPRVPAHGFRIRLSWNGDGRDPDLDLVLREPILQTYPEDDKTVWHSTTEGGMSLGGLFSGDSFFTRTPLETWTASSSISPGCYFVSTVYPYYSPSRATATARLECIIDGVVTTRDSGPLTPGERFDAFAVDITATGATIILPGSGELSERDEKQFEKFRLFGSKLYR